jgi:hypothetical protein
MERFRRPGKKRKERKPMTEQSRPRQEVALEA